MREFRALIEEYGWEVTSSWIDSTATIPLGVNELTPVPPDASETAREDYAIHHYEAVQAATKNLADLFRARVTIVFTRTPSTSGGYHTELGLALGAAKRVIIIGPPLNVFHVLPVIEHYDTFEEFLSTLRREDAA
jgi:hypothetical protein